MTDFRGSLVNATLRILWSTILAGLVTYVIMLLGETHPGQQVRYFATGTGFGAAAGLAAVAARRSPAKWSFPGMVALVSLWAGLGLMWATAVSESYVVERQLIGAGVGTLVGLLLLLRIWLAAPISARDLQKRSGWRWVTWSFRLLLVLAVAGVVAVTALLSQPIRQQLLLSKLHPHGVQVRNTAPAWVQDYLGDIAVRLFDQVVGVNGHASPLSDSEMAQIADLPQLAELSISSASAVTDKGLKELRGHPALTDLECGSYWVTGEGLTYLQEIPELMNLALGDLRITDGALEQLGGCNSLVSLTLGRTPLNGSALASLPAGLESLIVKGYRLDDAAVRNLGHLELLTTLVLHESRVTGAGLASLPVSLAYLDLAGSPIDDAGLAAARLDRLTRVDTLSLSGTKITQIQAATLPPNLATLDLSGTAVTDEGIQELSLLKKLTVLRLDFTKVSDVGLQHVSAMKGLWGVEVDLTLVTASGVDRLRTALPNAKVVWWGHNLPKNQ